MSCGKISFKNSCERSFTIIFYALFLLLLLLFLGPNLEAEEDIVTGWDQVSILTDNDLNDVLALNETAAFAVGENGKIYQTLDSGGNWSE